MKTEQRASVRRKLLQVNAAATITGTENDATVTDAEIEAFFNEEAAALV